MRETMLTDQQSRLLREEKEALNHILLKLADSGAPQDALEALQKAIMQLDELFLIVVVGEFNAGKSALINALLGERVLLEGVTPTTSRVTLLKWGEEVTERVVDEGFTIYTYPLPLLRELNIVDSPGTNAIIRRHEKLTDDFVPRSDLVLFTTSADRPMTESEKQFLERILAWGKKVVLVLNKVDIFEDESELQEARGFILKHAANVLGDSPEFFAVSARLAQRAWSASGEDERRNLRETSRMDALEEYIAGTLDDDARLQLKFRNPIGVAGNVITQFERAAQAQAEDLKDDLETVKSIDAAIAAYEHELAAELAPRLAEVENILQRLELRGLDFFDSTLRLTNIRNLMRGDKIRSQFEKQVLSDVPAQLDDQVQRLIDWLVDKDLHEWQQVMSYLQRRQALNFEHMVGAEGSPQAVRRRELVDTVGENARLIVESYDRNQEASKLASVVETAVLQTALFEVGAVGLGALVTTVLASSFLDVTGLLAAGTLAIVGFFVIPYKRRQAKTDFQEKMVTLREDLLKSLESAFKRESGKAVERLKTSVSPYTRFIDAEEERIRGTESLLAELRQVLSELRVRIERMV